MTAVMDRPPWPLDTCASCGASIVHAIHIRTLKPSVVDAWPCDEGTIQLVAAAGAVLYRVVPPERRRGQPLRTSHFATCPNAAQHRRRAS